MAPEVIRKQKYTKEADVYSFGVVIVEIYTGMSPYSDEKINRFQLNMKIINGLKPDISKLPPTLAQLVQDCWDPKPKLRPSFSEILSRLRRLKNLALPFPLSVSSVNKSFKNIVLNSSDDSSGNSNSHHTSHTHGTSSSNSAHNSSNSTHTGTQGSNPPTETTNLLNDGN